MATVICPRCGSSIAGPELPGQALACPACAARLRLGSEGVVAPPRIAPLPHRGFEFVGADDSPSQEIVLPFDPAAEKADDLPDRAGQRQAVRGLAAAAVFLIVLIGAVELARSLRPLLGRFPTLRPVVLAAWTHALASGTEAEQQQAAAAIVAAGPRAVAAVLDRITEIQGDKPLIDMAAVRALAATGGDMVADLGQALREPKANVRIGAASVLREMGPDGRRALGDENDPQRRKAWKLTLKALLAALDDENRWVRCFALETIGNLGSEAKSVVPAVAVLLEHPDAFTRRRAAEALGRIGPAAEKATAALDKASQSDPDVSVQQVAGVALHQIELPEIARDAMDQADPEVQGLCRTLLDGDDDVAAAAAAKTLGSMGLAAKDGLPALALALRHAEKSRREAAAVALGKLGPYAIEFLPTLQAAAKDAEPQVRAAAEQALAEIEGPSPPR
jgi:HEAT repeat protein